MDRHHLVMEPAALVGLMIDVFAARRHLAMEGPGLVKVLVVTHRLSHPSHT